MSLGETDPLDDPVHDINCLTAKFTKRGKEEIVPRLHWTFLLKSEAPSSHTDSEQRAGKHAGPFDAVAMR